MAGAKIKADIDPDCLEEYEAFKDGKGSSYIVYKLVDKFKRVAIDTKGTSGDNWETMMSNLPEDEPRFCVFSYSFDVGLGERTKIIFLFWCPMTSKVKARICYNCSKQHFRAQLPGLALRIHADAKGGGTNSRLLDTCKLKFKE